MQTGTVSMFLSHIHAFYSASVHYFTFMGSCNTVFTSLCLSKDVLKTAVPDLYVYIYLLT